MLSVYSLKWHLDGSIDSRDARHDGILVTIVIYIFRLTQIDDGNIAYLSISIHDVKRAKVKSEKLVGFFKNDSSSSKVQWHDDDGGMVQTI